MLAFCLWSPWSRKIVRLRKEVRVTFVELVRSSKGERQAKIPKAGEKLLTFRFLFAYTSRRSH
jgi:hypothetical protein